MAGMLLGQPAMGSTIKYNVVFWPDDTSAFPYCYTMKSFTTEEEAQKYCVEMRKNPVGRDLLDITGRSVNIKDIKGNFEVTSGPSSINK